MWWDGAGGGGNNVSTATGLPVGSITLILAIYLGGSQYFFPLLTCTVLLIVLGAESRSARPDRALASPSQQLIQAQGPTRYASLLFLLYCRRHSCLWLIGAVTSFFAPTSWLSFCFPHDCWHTYNSIIFLLSTTWQFHIETALLIAFCFIALLVQCGRGVCFLGTLF